MTERRSFKTLVRARMARTGESYTTARRHVLATAPAGPPVRAPGQLPGYDVLGGGTHHDPALLANVLRATGHVAPHTGMPWSEAMLAGLAGGIGFLYAVFEYAGHPPTMTVVTRHHPEPYLEAALRRAGIAYDIARTTSSTRATAALRSVVGEERPAICTVDRGRLPWHAPVHAFAAADPWEVAVAGWDGENVLLDDECLRPNPLPLVDFVDAWSSHRKGRHAMLTVAGPPSAVDLPDAATDAVATACAHLTGPVLGTSFDVNFGFSGMRRLAAQLRDDRTRTGWARRWPDGPGLFWALRRLHDCLEVEYGGPGASRPQWAQFLTEAGTALERGTWLAAADLVGRSGVVWSRIAAEAVGRWPALSSYDELVTERLRLQLTEGAAAVDAIRGMGARVEDLARRFAADPPAAREVRDLLDHLADSVDEARSLEEEAVDLLTA